MNPADLYLRVREREGRLYPDEIVRRLPDIPADHPLANEWHLRASSSARLIRYLERLGRPLAVLELGCGNGWLSAQAAHTPEAQIWGLDRYTCELVQAARLFASPNL
ncbi:MAG: SAM-dependent methyltransferase, partial [Chloroflexota bacterium]